MIMSDDKAPDGFEFVDTVPEKGNPVAADDPTCEVCGTPIPWAGRGRKPKRCDEHKRNQSTSKGTRSAKNSAVVQRAIEELDMAYAGLGTLISLRYKTAGTAVAESSTQLAESYRMLLETNAKFRNFFLKMESKAAIVPIIMVHAQLATTIFFAMQVDNVITQSTTSDNGTV